MRWSTTNLVVDAEPDRRFAFETKQSGARWSYVLEPDGDGTLVTESRSMWRDRPRSASIALKLFLGGEENHEQEMRDGRSEERTSELQSLMRSSYAVFCLKKKKKKT